MISEGDVEKKVSARPGDTSEEVKAWVDGTLIERVGERQREREK